MSEFTAAMQPVGGVTGGLTQVGGLSGSMTLVAGPAWAFSQVAATGRLTPVPGSAASMTPTHDPDLGTPFLEITPEILWIADWGTNNVISNTDWTVD